MRAALALIAGLVAAPAALAQAECGAGLDPKHRRVAEAPGLRLAFAPQPAPWATGRHFALEIEACPRAGEALPAALSVDADMPAHRHGMNYRPTVRATGPGRFRADGLMLHMPGRWRLMFEVPGPQGPLRLQHEIELP